MKNNINILELFPSDGQTIPRSSDYLFIIKLLSHSQKGKRRKYFSLFFDEASSKSFYLREEFNKKYYHPIKNNRVEILDCWRFKCNIRCNKILNKFIKKYYGLRVSIINSKKGFVSFRRIMFQDMIIIDENNKFINSNYIKLNNSMKYPVKLKDDLIIDRMVDYRDLVVDNIELEKIFDKEKYSLCPIDGIVVPVFIKVNSLPQPVTEKEKEIGVRVWVAPAEWKSKVCPFCLFCFSEKYDGGIGFQLKRV